MGSLPSSRLTKILQEKAETLKRRRQAAEGAAAQATERLHQLSSVEVVLPESDAREAALKDLTRRSDWDAVESGAKSLLDYLDREGAPRVVARREELKGRMARLAAAGAPVPVEVPPLLEESASFQEKGSWPEAIERLLAVLETVKVGEAKYADTVEAQIRGLAEWAGESPDHLAVALARSGPYFEAIRQGHTGDGAADLASTLERELPSVAVRREASRATAQALASVAQELGVPFQAITGATEADGAASILHARETVGRLDQAAQGVADAVRDRVSQTIDSYRATLGSLRDSGVDPAAALTELETIGRQVPGSPPSGLPPLLTQARSVVEEPVVGVVAGLLDEVRPKLVEARRLGRNSSEVFAAMNRAREALRLKIYGEALAASQEALDRVVQLTEDLEAARGEVQTLEELLRRLAPTRFPVAGYAQPIAEVREMIDRVDLGAAQEHLRSTLQRLGNEAVAFYQAELDGTERLGRAGGELGFTPPEFGNHLSQARTLLSEGSIADAAEAAARLRVELRLAAQPYFARRVEEITKSLEEIPDAGLIDPVRRLLADADVGLRVKEDLKGALETLRRAEREFSVVFAQHASALVEGLEEERRLLESMGGTGDEMQRQIDEVQQIFNMGDFVKAFRAAQEIRTRAHQQQLVRSEESVSHAKLALVELGKLGLDTIALKAGLDRAADAAKDGQYPVAYRGAHEVLEAAHRLRTTAQASLDRILEVTDLWEQLKQSGVQVQPYAEQIGQARAACQALDFERARRIVDTLHEQLDLELARFEAGRLVLDAEALLEDGRRLAVPVEPFGPRLKEVKDALVQGGSRQLWNRARAVHNDLIALLRPVLEENVRSLERDVEIARSAELDVSLTVELLAEIRRRLALPVPVGVAEVLDLARSRFFETKGFLEHAELVTRRARESLNRAEIVRVDVRAFRQRMERVERHLGERDYARVIDLAGTLERELTQATHQQVSKTLASYQGSVVRARKEGAETALAENLLEQARHALEAGEPVDALQLAARAEGELERVELQVLVAQGSIDSIDRRIQAAAREGVHAPEARKQFDAARAAFEARKFPVVLELTMLAGDALGAAVVAQRRAREAIENAERQVREASEMNAELGEVLPTLERARAAAKDGQYDAAVQRARDGAEAARWAIERLYAGPLAELGEMIELVRSAGTEPDALAVRAMRDDADAALKIRDWTRANDLLGKGRELAWGALDRAVETARRALETVYGTASGATEPAEAEHRAQVAERLAEDRRQHNYLSALETIREEESHARELLRQELVARVGALQERLWVGEKLGIDTTPVMEVFSEAKLAMDSGRLEPVAGLVQRGIASLETLVRRRIEEKLREVETELVFARDGLHVTLGGVPQRCEQARQLLGEGAPVDAARTLLEAEEELNRRKALHRELMNLHFLVDAALSRATERRLDTAAARALLEESIRARSHEYGPALEKAREALKLLQEAIQRVDPSASPPVLRPRGFDPSA